MPPCRSWTRRTDHRGGHRDFTPDTMARRPLPARDPDRDMASSSRRARTFPGVLSRTFARCRRPLRRIADGPLWPPLFATVWRMLLGGLRAASRHHPWRRDRQLEGRARVSGGDAEFFRPLPASAIIPVAILFLGLTQQMSLVVIAFGAIWPVLLGSVYGFSTIKHRLREVSASLEISGLEFFRHIALPSGVAGYHLRRTHQSRDCTDPVRRGGDAGVPARVGTGHHAGAAPFPQRGPVCRPDRAGCGRLRRQRRTSRARGALPAVAGSRALKPVSQKRQAVAKKSTWVKTLAPMPSSPAHCGEGSDGHWRMGEGFEPPVPLRARRFSRPVP